MSAAPTHFDMIKEHDELNPEYYSWLREAKHSNVDHKAARLRGQCAERAVNCAISKLLKTRLRLGLAHKKVKTLIGAISSARACLRTLGHEQYIFSNKNTIGILVS